MKHARHALIAAAMATCALAGCTASVSGTTSHGVAPMLDGSSASGASTSDGGSWPKGGGGAPPADQAAPPAAAGEPRTHLAGSGTESCLDLALGPWADVAHGPDPLGRVRDGIVPALPDGSDSPPDQLTEFPDLDSYRDPSTLEDPGMVHDAWQQAGFEQGIEARWGEGHAYTAITVVQFRDAAAAKDALTAHLTDLCQRATTASIREGSNGLLLARDSDAVRSVYVMGDIEVSVFTCSCYWPDLDHRKAGITDWAAGVETKLSGPRPDSGTA